MIHQLNFYRTIVKSCFKIYCKMKNYLKIPLLIAALMLSSSILFAQTEMTLEDALSYAKENSLAIQNARLNIADADAQIAERRAVGLPQLNGALDYSYYFKVPTVKLPEAFIESARDPMTGELPEDFNPNVSFSLKHNFNAGLTLNTLLFDGSYLTGLKAARLYRQYANSDMVAKEKEVGDQVREAYLPSLLITESLKILDKNMANLQKLLDETSALYKEGFVEQLDVDRLALSLANLKTERENLLRQQESAVNYLKFAINFPIGDELLLTDDINSLLKEATEAELSESVNYKNHPQHRVAEMSVQLNGLNVEQFQRGYLPSVAAYASYQYGYQGDKFDKSGFWFPTGIVGAQVNIPIFDGFDKRSKIQRARLAEDIARNQKRELERAITLELENARTSYRNALQRVNSQHKNMDLAERIYNTTMVKYREGVGSSIEISQAEQSLYTTQQNYTQALYDLLVAKAALDKALGN